MAKKRNQHLIGFVAFALLFATTLWSAPAQAGPDPFIGEISMFGGNFAPRSWALCDGQLLAISQNSALFSLLGTTYGGDGRTTFALPDLRGRFAMHAGTGPGLSQRRLGQKGGQEQVTLGIAQLPSHNHSATTTTTATATATLHATNVRGDSETPAAKILASRSRDNDYSNAPPDVVMSAASIEVSVSADSSTTIGNQGGSQAHDNMPPFQVVNYIIALQGIYPSRN